MRSTNSTIGKSCGESNLTPQSSKPINLIPAKNAIERLKMLLKKNLNPKALRDIFGNF